MKFWDGLIVAAGNVVSFGPQYFRPFNDAGHGAIHFQKIKIGHHEGRIRVSEVYGNGQRL